MSDEAMSQVDLDMAAQVLMRPAATDYYSANTFLRHGRGLLVEVRRLREQETKLLEVKRVCAWAELLMREVAPEVAAEMRKAIEGAK